MDECILEKDAKKKPLIISAEALKKEYQENAPNYFVGETSTHNITNIEPKIDDFFSKNAIRIYPSKNCPFSPIDKYNYFVCFYNKDCDEFSSNNKFKLMKSSRVYNFAFLLINNQKLKWLTALSLFFLPFFNIILACIIFISLLYYKRGLSVYLSNKLINPNPFDKMIYAPEVCEEKGIINESMEIELSGIKIDFSLIIII